MAFCSITLSTSGILELTCCACSLCLLGFHVTLVLTVYSHLLFRLKWTTVSADQAFLFCLFGRSYILGDHFLQFYFLSFLLLVFTLIETGAYSWFININYVTIASLYKIRIKCNSLPFFTTCIYLLYRFLSSK